MLQAAKLSYNSFLCSIRSFPQGSGFCKHGSKPNRLPVFDITTIRQDWRLGQGHPAARGLGLEPKLSSSVLQGRCSVGGNGCS
jgi:hypothetical protein